MINIKKILFYMVIALAVLSGCQSTKSNAITELNPVTKEVQEYIDPSYKLQLLDTDGNTAYIVVQTSGEVSADFDVESETFIVYFDVKDDSGDALIQHVYALKTESDIEVIEVYMNGEFTPFDNVTGI